MARTDARNGSTPAAGPSKPSTSQQLPLFEMSSQFKHWRYSEAGLLKARSDLNATAVQRVQSMLQEEKEVEQQEGQPKTQDADVPKPSDVEYLTVEDEQSLVTYYLQQLTRLCKMFKFPVNVASTAMTYLKRFYIRNTCMDYHPKNVMLTCLFLATKTENHVMSLDSFTSQIPKCTNEDVLSLEFLVSQSLKFQYKCHHADLAGRGIMLDMQTLLADQADIDHLVEVTYPRAHSTILSLRITDAEFLYTPSQIALAAFHAVDPVLTERWLESKLDLSSQSTLRKPAAADEKLPELEEILNSVVNPIVALADAAKAGKLTDIEKVRQVDRRLRFCKNPEKDPNSSLYKKRQREHEEEEMSKRVKKEEVVRKKEEVFGDPFN